MSKTAKDDPRRNILWIMTDQQRLDGVGAFGGAQVHTPHLDSLAAEGVCFDRHYTTCPLCVPARGSLATGRYPHSCGSTVNAIFWKEHGELEHATLGPRERTAGERLLEAGYRVGQIGVDHVITEPRDRQRKAFDLFYDFSDYGKWASQRNLPAYDAASHRVETEESAGGHTRVGPYSGPQPGRHPQRAEDFADFVWADRAVEFLEETEDGEEPWALFLYLWAPHPPLVWPEPYCSMYDPEAIALAPSVGVPGEGRSELHDRHAAGQLGSFIKNREDWKPTWAAYFGGCTLADDALGRVLDAARGREDYDRTAVVFHPDHGEALGMHRCYQKMTCYEECIHLPLIVRLPNAAPGRRAVLTSHVDVAPTLLDCAGLAPPGNAQGVSLAPLVDDPAARFDRDAVFCEYSGNVGWNYFQRSVVAERWKYIDNPGVDRELYDLVEDPYEMHNRINDAPGSVLDQMQDRLETWQKDTGDFLVKGGP